MENINREIENRINKYNPREPILIKELYEGLENNKAAVYYAISRVCKKNIIERYEKGIYFIPKKSKFGILKIDKDLLIEKKYIGEDNSLGYETGPSIWNKCNLTTQISNRRWIAQFGTKKREIKNLNLLIVRSKNKDINSQNVHMFQFLDILDQMKLIPDTNETEIIMKLKKYYLDKFTVDEQIKIFKYVKKYNRRVKFLLGLIASTIEDEYLK